MKLVFLGTRGYSNARTRRHKGHSALLERCGSQAVSDFFDKRK